jgi:small GTP-binding protein
MIKKKICMVGAFAAGKTSLVKRHVYSIFSETYHTTVGVKIDKKRMSVLGRQMDLIIWDLHGEDDFQTVRTSYLRGSAGFIYVVDGTRHATLDVALDLRARATLAVGDRPCIMALNKRDLRELWEITDADLEWLAKERIPVIETSAKTGRSVEKAFQTLAALVGEAP